MDIKQCVHEDKNWAFAVQLHEGTWVAWCNYKDCPRARVFGESKEDAIDKWNAITPKVANG